MRRGIKIVGVILLVLMGGGLLYGCGTMAMVRWEERHTPRDPVTGIAIGAEEKTLGPEDAAGAVLFVHGFVGGSSNFADLPEKVAAQGWRVRVMRLPGHGTSPRDFRKTTSEELIVAVRTELETLLARYPKVVIVGHSMGGSLATLMASERPVAGIVLAGSYFKITYHWWYGLKPETWAKICGPVVPYVYKGKTFLQINNKAMKPYIYSYTWIPTRGMQPLVEIGRKLNDPELLTQVQCPVLMLHAPGDIAASYGGAKEAFAEMGSGDKRFVDLPNSSHHVFWDYDKDLLQREVLAFVEKCLKG